MGLSLPRTYSTRMGALVPYSENLAEPLWKKGGRRMGLQGHRCRRKLQMELHTLQDLTRAILAYRGKQVRTNRFHEAPGSVPLDVNYTATPRNLKKTTAVH